MNLTLYFNGLVFGPAVVNSILVTIILVIFFVICNVIIKRTDPTKPIRGLMFLIEFAHDALFKFIGESVGDKAFKYVPFVFTIVSYLVVANLLGLFGLVPPTTNINITVAIAIFTLAYIMLAGIFAKGLFKYLKDTYIGDMPKPLLILFLPINIIGEISKLISLPIRLFGNIVSGTLLVAIVLQMLQWAAIPLFPILNGLFDIFAGLMQAVIFVTLAMIWVKDATESEA